MKKEYNTTQLNVEEIMNKKVFHRDYFAHYFRWTHIFKIIKLNAKKNKTLLDYGCGSGELLEVAYRNMICLEKYLGLDIRNKQIEINKEKFSNVKFGNFKAQDLCLDFDLNEKFDYITCFEVVEHIGHKNIDVFLQNIVKHADENTQIYLSTPNYDEKVGAAKNHIINGEIGEWKHGELVKKLEEYFVIEKKYGTFASMKDYKHLMNDWQKEMFEHLNEYYDLETLACLMAPFFPEQARNCLYVMKIKK